MTKVTRDVGDDWEVDFDPDFYSSRGYWTGDEPWIGELRVQPRLHPESFDRDDWRDGVQHAAAVYWQTMGFALGERPGIGETTPLPDGRIGVTVTGLVTVPPYWSGPPEVDGQLALWGAS